MRLAVRYVPVTNLLPLISVMDLHGLMMADFQSESCNSIYLQTLPLCFSGDILAIRDISVEESEDLPRIIQPLIDDAAARLAGNKQDAAGASIEKISAAMQAASPQLQRLQV